MSGAAPVVAVVLPCRNPEPGWAHAAEARLSALRAARPQWRWEVVVVDDGSTANVGSDERDALPRARWVVLDSHRGKGAALRAGVAEIEADHYILTDHDFPYDDASMLAVADASIAAPEAIVAGIRADTRRPGSPWTRAVLSSLMRSMNRRVLGLPIEDTQCGLKGFSRSGHEVFQRTVADGYAVDVDLLLLAHRARLPLRTIPVQWAGHRPAGSISLRVLAREARTLLGLMRRGRAS